jgi:hypothetical protein
LGDSLLPFDDRKLVEERQKIQVRVVEDDNPVLPQLFV